jgi:nitronate monooxygenase
MPANFEEAMHQSGLQALCIKGRQLLPIVQGGMGVGVSAHRLASAVALCGAVGTISSIDLRRLHPDLMRKSASLPYARSNKAIIDAANVEALKREIVLAKSLSHGLGMIAVNIMKAVSEYASYVQCALDNGADAIVVGAGLPLDLPDLAVDHQSVALIPILSEARGIDIVLKKWAKKHRTPDAIVIEHPRYAGGHLGASSLEDLNNPKFDFEVVIPQALALLKTMGLQGQVPLIAAGGIVSYADIKRVQDLGASAVQMGTAFAVTLECDAHPHFKHVLANAKLDDVVEFMSVAGLPARAVKTPWLENYIQVLPTLQAHAKKKERCTLGFDCLKECGLMLGNANVGQFCIDQVLASAVRGNKQKGLFFRGASALPFGSSIRHVRDLMMHLLNNTGDSSDAHPSVPAPPHFSPTVSE